MSRDQFWLTKAQFSKIKPHLPTDTRGKARVDDRRVISGIVQVLKSGARWVDAPPEYGPRKTLYNRYVRWAAKGSGLLEEWVEHETEGYPRVRGNSSRVIASDAKQSRGKRSIIAELARGLLRR